MAEIFLARATAGEASIERHVVLKRVLAEHSRDSQFADMFLDEVRLGAQLQHPNIAQLHDVGMLGGSYFFTMEYVHGEDVYSILQTLNGQRRHLPIGHALYIATSALAGLHHAHTRSAPDGTPLRIVHRDVSPTNIMVSFEGAVKLLDFGVAKASLRTAQSLAGVIKGKVAYLSPEQCDGRDVDPRTDVFALGIVLHEMLTGQRLFKRDTDFNTMMAITKESPPPPSQLRPNVPAEIDAVVTRALARDPLERYSDAAEMIEALEGAAARSQIIISGTALGRFMRELYGDRPFPWLALSRAPSEADRPITVSNVRGSFVATQPGVPPVTNEQLEQQLGNAPLLGAPKPPELEPPAPSTYWPTGAIPAYQPAEPVRPSQPHPAQRATPSSVPVPITPIRSISKMHPVTPPPPAPSPAVHAPLGHFAPPQGPEVAPTTSPRRGVKLALLGIAIAALLSIAIIALAAHLRT